MEYILVKCFILLLTSNEKYIKKHVVRATVNINNIYNSMCNIVPVATR